MLTRMELTQTELTDCRNKLDQARAIIETVKVSFFADRRIDAARLLNEVGHLLSDEVAALDKEVSHAS